MDYAANIIGLVNLFLPLSSGFISGIFSGANRATGWRLTGNPGRRWKSFSVCAAFP